MASSQGPPLPATSSIPGLKARAIAKEMYQVPQNNPPMFGPPLRGGRHAPPDSQRYQVIMGGLPQARAGPNTSESTTRSVYRFRWHNLAEWTNFHQLVTTYWATEVPIQDKGALVVNNGHYQGQWDAVTAPEGMTEADIKMGFEAFPAQIQNYLGIGLHGVPLPSDLHSEIHHCAAGAGNYGLVGTPDFILLSNTTNRVTALVEVKTPWLVTPAQIDAVIDGTSSAYKVSDITGTAPLTGDHPGRLAVEQLFGYMIRSSKSLGIISTMKGWCFGCRRDGSQLWLSRMYGEDVENGYYYPENGFTIMMALYYFTHLAEITPDTEETTGGRPGVVHLPPASADSRNPAPYVQVVPVPGQQYIQPAPYPNYYNQYRQRAQPIALLFQPSKKENYLGQKSWIARTLPEESKVVLKLWDGWKVDATDRNNEHNVYLRLEPLWGKYVPSLLACTYVDFCHALIVDYLDPVGYTAFGDPEKGAMLTTERDHVMQMLTDAKTKKLKA